ncbi:hypothetical protein ACFQ9X_05260 [Catenulispora yoronensis]
MRRKQEAFDVGPPVPGGQEAAEQGRRAARCSIAAIGSALPKIPKPALRGRKGRAGAS